MNFVVYLSFEPFSRILRAGSTAYIIPFALPGGKSEEESKGYLRITTDAGVEGGTIHALQIQFSDTAAGGLEVAVKASEKVAVFLKTKRVKAVRGILSTAGLHESLQYWGHVVRYSTTQLGALLEAAKKKALNERRRNQTNK